MRPHPDASAPARAPSRSAPKRTLRNHPSLLVASRSAPKRRPFTKQQGLKFGLDELSRHRCVSMSKNLQVQLYDEY